MSFLWIEQGELFTGDAIPVVGDIPIYVSARNSIETLKKLLSLDGVERYLPAWDDMYDQEAGTAMIKKSLDYLAHIDDTVQDVLAAAKDEDMETIYARVCAALNLKHLIQNPLFKASVYANIKETRR